MKKKKKAKRKLTPAQQADILEAVDAAAARVLRKLTAAIAKEDRDVAISALMTMVCEIWPHADRGYEFFVDFASATFLFNQQQILSELMKRRHG